MVFFPRTRNCHTIKSDLKTLGAAEAFLRGLYAMILRPREITYFYLVEYLFGAWFRGQKRE